MNYLFAHSDPMGLPENLQRLMDERGENPHSLAAKTKVTQPTIFRILKRTSLDPRRSNIEKLARFFGVTAEELYGRPTQAIHGDSIHAAEPASIYDLHNATIGEVVSILRGLTKSRQQEVLRFARERMSLQCLDSKNNGHDEP